MGLLCRAAVPLIDPKHLDPAMIGGSDLKAILGIYFATAVVRSFFPALFTDIVFFTYFGLVAESVGMATSLLAQPNTLERTAVNIVTTASFITLGLLGEQFVRNLKHKKSR